MPPALSGPVHDAPEQASALNRIVELADSGAIADAMVLAASADARSPRIANARAVCAMRLGKPMQAIEILRPLAFDATGLGIDPNANPAYLSNYATALLLDGNVDGFHAVLSAIRRRDHPNVRRLLDAAARSARNCSWSRWLLAFVGGAGQPIVLDGPPGTFDIEAPPCPT